MFQTTNQNISVNLKLGAWPTIFHVAAGLGWA
jgi:hypothetical protein